MNALACLLVAGICLDVQGQSAWEPLLEQVESRQVSEAEAWVGRVQPPAPDDFLPRMVSLLEQISPGYEWVPMLDRLSETLNRPPELQLQLALMHWRAGLDEEAIALCESIVEEAPQRLDLVYRCAAMAHTVDRLEKARLWVTQLLGMQPDHSDGLFLLGRIRADEGEEEEAERILQQVVAQDPGNFLAWYELGRLENRSADSEAAETALKEAVRLFPFFKEAYNALLIALARQQKTEEVQRARAIVAYLNQWPSEKESRLQFAFRNPGQVDPPLGYELAAELHKLGRSDLAMGFLRGANERGLIDDRQRLLLAQYEFREERNPEAMELLQAITDERVRGSSTFSELRAWLLFREGRMEAAREALSRGLERFPDSQPLQQLQARMNPTAGEQQSPLDVPQAEIRFRDASEESGLRVFEHRIGHPEKYWITDAMGSGVAVADYDRDGDDDLYFVNARPHLDREDPAFVNRLFRNDGGTFVDVTEAAGVGDAGFGMAAIFGDVNGDQWPDLYVANRGANQFYKNNGDGTFTRMTDEWGADDSGYAAAVAFGDVDADGDLDLFVGNYVVFDPERHVDVRDSYHGHEVFAGPLKFAHDPHALYLNDGSGRFTDASDKAGVRVSDGRAMGVVLLDLDLDGDLDLYVANDSTYNHILTNRGDGTFEDISFLSGAGFTESGVEGASMGVAAGDYNNDGLPDLLVTAYEQQSDVLYENLGDGLFRDVSVGMGIARVTRMKITWGCGFADWNADGWLDFYTANGHIYPQVDAMEVGTVYRQGVSFYQNRGDRFQLALHTADSETIEAVSGRGSALLDVDQDGDLDVVVSAIDGTPQVLLNETPQGNWLQVRLEAPAARVLGARVVARAGDTRWSRWVDGGSGYLSQNSRVVHFGFGEHEAVDSVSVHWVGGGVTTVDNPALRQVLRVSGE